MAEVYRAVFISPHLDDAVFSCGAEIDRLVAEGPVLVINLFSRFVGEVRCRGVVLGPERLGEELAAARFLGFETRSLDELDASCRLPAYRALGNLFKPPQVEDLAWLSALRETLFSLLAGLRYQCLYVPLAIGWHVDHVLTYRVFEPWIGLREDLLFYEDQPYGLMPHAASWRLAELGPSTANAEPPARLWLAWREAARAYADTAMMRRLEPKILRVAARPVVSIYLLRLMAFHQRQARRGILPALAWTPRPGSAGLSEGRLRRKLQAMMLYRSQFQEFFLDAQDCRRQMTRYASTWAQDAVAVERYWHATVASTAGLPAPRFAGLPGPRQAPDG